jgi:hypothetical protein
MYFKQGRPEGKGQLGAICYKRVWNYLVLRFGGGGGPKREFCPGSKKRLWAALVLRVKSI